jgi:hypothetical protein
MTCFSKYQSLLSSLLITCAFLLVISNATNAAEATSHLFQPSFHPAKSCTEIFALSCLCDDEMFIQILMTVTNLGVSDRNTTSKILVFRPGQESFKANMYYESKNWSYSDSPVSTLVIGTCTIMQKSDKIEFDGKLDGASVNIILEGTASKINPPNTDFNSKPSKKFKVQPAKRFYEYEILIPWSKAKVTVALPGKSPITQQGYGTLDHSRSVGTPRDISNGWVTFRGRSGDSRFFANFRFPPDKKSPPVGWIWKEGTSAPTGMKGLSMTMQPDSKNGKDVKAPLITSSDHSFSITVGERFYRYSFIHEMGPILGSVVKLVVGDPITTYYNAEAKVRATEKPFRGVLEILSIE